MRSDGNLNRRKRRGVLPGDGGTWWGWGRAFVKVEGKTGFYRRSQRTQREDPQAGIEQKEAKEAKVGVAWRWRGAVGLVARLCEGGGKTGFYRAELARQAKPTSRRTRREGLRGWSRTEGGEGKRRWGRCLKVAVRGEFGRVSWWEERSGNGRKKKPPGTVVPRRLGRKSSPSRPLRCLRR